eukprot:365042-Chlamydomonas_euryale.AAC.9
MDARLRTCSPAVNIAPTDTCVLWGGWVQEGKDKEATADAPDHRTSRPRRATCNATSLLRNPCHLNPCFLSLLP